MSKACGLKQKPSQHLLHEFEGENQGLGLPGNF